ncbi:MAG: DNA primase [Saprospiraceae bacterium]|nr:DNA primase [Saprospiraceae bacterium]
MIAPHSIQEVIETVKIEAVVEEFVTLKRRGVNLIGNCPFHNEKTPSFTVSPAKNLFKCFGCGKGGSAVTFLMEHEQLSFVDAIRWLARKFQIELEETAQSESYQQQALEAESLHLVNQFALQFFQENMFETDRGKSIGLSYFKQRGFREETIKKFGLGYALNETKHLFDAAIKKGYTKEILQKAALVTQHERDFFRDRMMFPIHSLTGKVLGFGGRILQKDIHAPKYINTPETEIYNKSKILYGLFFAKKAIRQHDECILVEGYTDVIALHQAGIENVVASSGTSLTTEQISLIKRYTPNIKVLYDGDTAGVKAALRGLDMILEQELNVKLVLLPGGEDPDSYLQKVGTDVFKDFIATDAKDFVLFKTTLLMQEAGNDPIRKSRVIAEVVDSLAKIKVATTRSIFVKECANILSVEERILTDATNKVLIAQLKKNKPEVSNIAESNKSEFPDNQDVPDLTHHLTAGILTASDEHQERDIIRILMLFGGKIYENELPIAEFILQNIEDVITNFENPLYLKIIEDYRQRRLENLNTTLSYFISHEDKNVQTLAINFATSPYEYSPNWADKHQIYMLTQNMPEENFVKDALQSLQYFKLKKVLQMSKKNKEKLKNPNLSAEELSFTLQVQIQIDKIKTELSKALGIVVLKV